LFADEHGRAVRPLHAAQLRGPLVPDVPDVVVQRHVVEGFAVEVVVVHVHDVPAEAAAAEAITPKERGEGDGRGFTRCRREDLAEDPESSQVNACS
jgi:hypothetical protein